MNGGIDHDILDDALGRSGASWDAAQSHGLLSARIAVAGQDALPGVIDALFQGTDASNALRGECENMVEALFAGTYEDLAARLSAFTPLLPDDTEPASRRAEAIAHWSEGFLHGLVSGGQDDATRARLAEDPLADIIKDLLQITRAVVDEEDSEDSSEAAYADIVEYLRTAGQLVFEELDAQRPGATT